MIEIPSFITDAFRNFRVPARELPPEADLLGRDVVPWLTKHFDDAKKEISGYDQTQLESLRRLLGSAIKKSEEPGNRIILSNLLTFVAETSFKKAE